MKHLKSKPALLLCALLLMLSRSTYVFGQAEQTVDMETLANNPPLFLKTATKLLKWEEPAEPFKIVGPIYFVGTKGLGAFLITTTEGHILLNTGMPSSGPMHEASIRKLGFKPEDIKILLTGHAHSDHAGGLAYIKKLSGAQMASIDMEKDLLESGGKLDFHYGKYKEFEFEPVKVDRVLRDGEIIKLGDVAITALLTNGHTHGSTTFVTNVVDGGKVYTVVFPNGTSVNPGYQLVVNPSYPGIADDYRRTLHILEMLKPDIWLGLHAEWYDPEGKRARAATGRCQGLGRSRRLQAMGRGRARKIRGYCQ